jgi:hypothetical protein
MINQFNFDEAINQFRKGEDDQPVQKRMKIINQFDSDEGDQPVQER